MSKIESKELEDLTNGVSIQMLAINGVIETKDFLGVELKPNVFLLKEAGDDLIEYLKEDNIKHQILTGKITRYMELQQQFPNFPSDAILEK